MSTTCPRSLIRISRDVSNLVVFMRDGVIWEEGAPQQIFAAPQRQETKDFLSRFMEL